MSCRLKDRCAPDGTRVAIFVPDDIKKARLYRTADDIRVAWEGTPGDLVSCECDPVDYTCTAEAETAEITNPPPMHILQQRELSRGQRGWTVARNVIPAGHPNEILPSDNPFTIPIPAHAAGSVIALFVAYGGEDIDAGNGTNAISMPSVTLSGSDVSAPVVVWDSGVDSPVRECGGFIVYMNGLTGSAGSSLELTFGQFDVPASPPIPGTVQWVVNEYTSDQPSLTVADFDIGSAAIVSVEISASPADPANPPIRTHEPVDMGDCDALFHAFARHVKEDLGNGQVHYDSNWADMGTGSVGYEELQDISAQDGNEICQLGQTSGLVRGGNGDTAYTYEQNYHWSAFDGESMSTGIFVPTVCGVSATDTQFEELCQVVAKNQCPGSAVSVACSMEAEVDITVAAGDSATVTPYINGVAITSAAQTVNTAGTSTVSINATAAGADIAQGGADTTHTFYLRLTGIGQASANAWSAKCTTTQI